MLAPAHISHDSDSERPTKVESRKHSFYIHFPKDRNCEVCLRAKMNEWHGLLAEDALAKLLFEQNSFGDLITADHKVLNEEGENNHRHAVVVQDLATQRIQSYPCKTKTSQDTEKSLRKFLEPPHKPKVFFSDNSLEYGKSCEDLSWDHRTSTPHRSETNGIAEKGRKTSERRYFSNVATIKIGWKVVGWFYGMLLLSAKCPRPLGKQENPYERRFGEPIKGPIISFGAVVEYYPISTRDQSRLHQIGKKVLPGIFLGYGLIAGRIWKGDVR